MERVIATDDQGRRVVVGYVKKYGRESGMGGSWGAHGMGCNIASVHDRKGDARAGVIAEANREAMRHPLGHVMIRWDATERAYVPCATTSEIRSRRFR